GIALSPKWRRAKRAGLAAFPVKRSFGALSHGAEPKTFDLYELLSCVSAKRGRGRKPRRIRLPGRCGNARPHRPRRRQGRRIPCRFGSPALRFFQDEDGRDDRRTSEIALEARKNAFLSEILCN